MSQTRVSQFFKRKETAKIKRKQTSTDTFCVKTYRHMFNDEVICWNTRKKEETARPVGRPRKYDSISVNELHDFNDFLEFGKWYNEKYSKLYIELAEPKTTRKRFSSQKKRRHKAFLFDMWKLSRNSKSISTSGFHCS